jgi:hypothetical protein
MIIKEIENLTHEEFEELRNIYSDTIVLSRQPSESLHLHHFGNV